MKVKTPICFRTSAGEVVSVGEEVDAAELERFQKSRGTYQTKVVRQTPVEPVQAPKPPAKKSARKTSKKAD